MKNKSFVIIPARGGSKRIPRKNLLEVLGKPLIQWTLENLISCEVFDEIIVTSDDFEIRQIAKGLGINMVLERSPELSNDEIPTRPVIIDAIKRIKNISAEDLVCVVYPTSALVSGDIYIESHNLAEKILNEEMIQGVIRFIHPIERAFTIGVDGYLRSKFPEFQEFRTQDLEECFYDAGQFYWAKSDSWLNAKEFARIPFRLDESVIRDLDTKEDLEIFLKIAKEVLEKRQFGIM